jgi:predicted aminopeptidase
MPYLGFFNIEEANREKERLVKKDLDVSIGVAEAYSTLGWFKDPITLNLLKRSTAELTETILHEMTHTTLYLKGQGEFNEGLANLVGKVGAVYYLEKSYGHSHPFTIEAKNVLADERIFASFISSLFDRLEELYYSDMTYEEKLNKREEIFAMHLEEYETIKVDLMSNRFKGFGEYGLNNAYIMAIGLYHRHFDLFETLLQENNNSIRDMLAYCKNMADEGKDMMEVFRKYSLKDEEP